MREQRSQELWQQIGEVWHLSLPAILTQITTIAMQYIDSAMVGALGANASAAIGLVATTTWLFGGITYAIAAGFSVQVAHHIGGKKEKEARQVVCHGLLVALLVSGILCLIGLSISGKLPVWLGGNPERCIGVFYGLCADGTVFTDQFPEFVFPAVQRRHGDTKYPECNHVCVGCDFQCTSDTKIRSYGCRDGNSACLCMRQPDHDGAVLYPQ